MPTMTTPAPTAPPGPTASDVSAIVRAEVARRRVSGAALAESLGLTQTAMSRRLRGVTPFSVDELVKVARVLDMPAAELLP